jgi:hypothetical protein
MMRRMFPVALLSALLVLATSAFAQRGSFSGGHSGGSAGHFGGSVGHFSGGSVGHFSAPAFGNPGRIPGFPTHSFGAAPRMTFPAPEHAFRSPVTAPFFNDRDRGGYGGWRGRSGEDHGDRHRRPYRGYGYAGYAYPYAYANSWELLPWDLGYSDFSGYDNSDFDSQPEQQPANPEAAAPADNGYSYRPGYEQPGYEQPEDNQGYPPPPPPPDSYGLGSYDPASATSRNSIAPEPNLMLIFKDGHQESIQNFVLTPTTVIVMDQPATGRQKRIPLADLNLPATQQAAQQSGLDFSPPS